MKLTAHPELLELLAASHALGTLRGGARRRFETLAREQAPVRAAALVWQGRLASMTELQSPVVPDPAVWTRIRNMIDAEQAQLALARQREAAAAAQQRKPAGGWLGSLALWRGATAAGALATVLAVTVGLNLRDQLQNAPAVQYVAVLSDDKDAASMLVTFDPKKRQLVLQRVGGFSEGADKSLQLWALPRAARRARWACSTARRACGCRPAKPTCARCPRSRSASSPRAAYRAKAGRPARCSSRVH